MRVDSSSRAKVSLFTREEVIQPFKSCKFNKNLVNYCLYGKVLRCNSQKNEKVTAEFTNALVNLSSYKIFVLGDFFP
jgi:hypothetical protein